MAAKSDGMNGNGTHSTESLTLEARLNGSIVPRKAFEVYDLKGEMPITCTQEVIDVADLYLEQNGIDKTGKDDATQWDIFWAREMVAAKIVIADRRVGYPEYLPGRYFTYDLLVDSMASLFNGGEANDNFAGKRIAELGGGSGLGLMLLAQKGAFVTNIDTSKMALEFSRYLSEHHEIQDKLDRRNSDFYDTGLSDNEFDVVYNHGVFEHREVDAHKLLHEMTRITKPGGYVVIAVPNEASPFYKRLEERHESVYKRFKDVIVVMPWHHSRRVLDLKKLIGETRLDFVTEGGLLIPPSEEVGKKDISKGDIPTFEKYLSPEPPGSVGSILTNWRGFHGSVDPHFRMKYGWSVYAVGQKKAA
tara:strand:- start:912 stop:1994 length:1083 start_codon:yes stop_codon:yes gene_type:complete